MSVYGPSEVWVVSWVRRRALQMPGVRSSMRIIHIYIYCHEIHTFIGADRHSIIDV